MGEASKKKEKVQSSVLYKGSNPSMMMNHRHQYIATQPTRVWFLSMRTRQKSSCVVLLSLLFFQFSRHADFDAPVAEIKVRSFDFAPRYFLE